MITSGDDLTKDRMDLAQLYLHVEAQVRKRLPSYARDEVIDKVLVAVYLREMRSRDLTSREGLATRIARDECASWHRCCSRRPLLALPMGLPMGPVNALPSAIICYRHRLALLAPRLLPLLTERQGLLFKIIRSGQIPSLRYVCRQMGFSLKDLRGMVRLIAKKVRRLESRVADDGRTFR